MFSGSLPLKTKKILSGQINFYLRNRIKASVFGVPPITIRISHPVQDSTKVSLESDPADISRTMQPRPLGIAVAGPLDSR